jgi:hypothetical protein
MAVSSNQSAPYAPAAAVLEVLDRYRHTGMQTPFTNDVLGRAGISQSLIPRTLQSLQVLDLIDQEGNPTQTLEGIRAAPEAEYQKCLAEWIRGAYSEVFQFADPQTDDEVRIRDAFRNYRPYGQQSRMVALFIRLCVVAGLHPENGREQKARTRRTSQRPLRQTRQAARALGKTGDSSTNASDIPPALAGLLNSLPGDGGTWTKERRDKFVQTFEAVLDFCYPIEQSADNPEGRV